VTGRNVIAVNLDRKARNVNTVNIDVMTR
jgi:hypothetical protein